MNTCRTRRARTAPAMNHRLTGPGAATFLHRSGKRLVRGWEPARRRRLGARSQSQQWYGKTIVVVRRSRQFEPRAVNDGVASTQVVSQKQDGPCRGSGQFQSGRDAPVQLVVADGERGERGQGTPGRGGSSPASPLKSRASDSSSVRLPSSAGISPVRPSAPLAGACERAISWLTLRSWRSAAWRPGARPRTARRTAGSRTPAPRGCTPRRRPPRGCREP